MWVRETDVDTSGNIIPDAIIDRVIAVGTRDEIKADLVMA